MGSISHTSSTSGRRLGARLLPVLLAASLALPLLSNARLSPLMSLLAGSTAMVVLGVFALLEPRAGRTIPPLVTATLLSTFLLAAWLTARALLSASPHQSFLGAVGQHSGAALWIVSAGWLAGAVLVADKRSLRDTLGVVAVFGALFATLGVAEALTTGAREWGSAAGPFENSSSLGGFLSIALFACAAWGLSHRSAWPRVLATLGVMLCLAGIGAADSRTGLAGVVAGLAFAGLLFLGRHSATRTRLLALLVPLAGAVTTAALTLAATDRLGPGARHALASLGTGRDAIWDSAATQIAASPLFGRGPEMFSAWVDWSFNGGALSFNATYDPHSALLGLVLGGGAVAALVAFAAAATGLVASISVFEDTRRSASLAPLVAAPVALGGAALFAWLTPAALIATAAITGALLANARDETANEQTASHAARIAVVLVLVLATASMAVIGATTRAFAPEHAFVSDQDFDLEGAAALYESWPDPEYASFAASRALVEGMPIALLRERIAGMDAPAAHHVDLALRLVFLEQRAVAQDAAEWQGFVDAIERGVQADPASGLWYTLAAAQADALGMTREARAYANAALGFKLTPQDRAYLEPLADLPGGQ